MRIAVASGKGGTGKTTVSTSLAQSQAAQSSVSFIDCDVEAPNAHLFLHPDLTETQEAVILIPEIDETKCNACGKCVEVCQFNALAQIGKNILVFAQLCHGCGSCSIHCPQQAITEKPNPIGVLEAGLTRDNIHFTHGKLTVSEPMPTPIIHQLKRWQKDSAQDNITVIDSPPGASCAVVETLQESDFALLVTEPTPFGLHDLKQILQIVKDFNIPAGVVINRDGIGDSTLEDYLTEHDVPVLMRIPYDPAIAAGVAAGKTLPEIDPRYRQQFQDLYERIRVLSA